MEENAAREGSVAELRARVRALEVERDSLETRTHWLEHRVKRLTYLLYGRKSERLTAFELKQLALALDASELEADRSEPEVPHSPAPEEAPGDDPGPADGKKPTKRKHPGRSRLSPELERILEPVPVPENERHCQCCGEEMSPFRTVEHERIEYIPEKLVVHVEQREVLGCKRCRGDVATAPRQTPAIQRRAGHSLIATLIESKCDDALPIHRQQDRLRRLGFDVPVNTLYGYFEHGTDLLEPIAKVALSAVTGDAIVRVDDTTLKVLDRRHPKKRYTGRLWCFLATEQPLVAFIFTSSWAAEEIAPYLGAISGFIQCDDYKGYSSQIRGSDGLETILVPPERRLGCMMHVRRRFVDAFRLGLPEAAAPIEWIREIYAIETVAKERALDAGARLGLRESESLPWLTQFNAWVARHEGDFSPRSKLGEAVRYARQQRPFVDRCFTDGRFEIDNGAVEREMREVAIGRRNFLFTGSAKAAERLAAAYTLVQSCRRIGISTREYLIDVMAKVEAGWPLRRIGELLPTHWAQDRGLWKPADSNSSASK